MKLKRINWILFFIFPTVLCLGSKAFAHNVSVFGWVEGDTVFVEGKLAGGKRPKGAKVQVLDANGKVLNEGVTDQNGAFQFKIPHPMRLNIVLNAGFGHRAEWVITEEDMRDSEVNDSSRESEQNSTISALRQSTTKNKDLSTHLTVSEIEAIVDRSLARRLAPIRRELSEIRSTGPDFKDILGGIGYILGLIGLAAYIKFRKRDN